MRTTCRSLLFLLVLSMTTLAQEGVRLRYETSSGDAAAPRVFSSQPLHRLRLGLIENEHAVFRHGDERGVVSVGTVLAKEAFQVLAIQPQRLLVKTPSGYGLIKQDASGWAKLHEMLPAELPPELKQNLEKMQRESSIERPSPR